MTIGLEGLVQHVRRQPGTSEWYIKGFGRITPELKRFLATAAVASHVPDAFLTELLEDDRIALRPNVFEEALEHEVSWISRLHHQVWVRLVRVTGEESA
eukprot:8557205-Heterocapsa_arctica.AAC.1